MERLVDSTRKTIFGVKIVRADGVESELQKSLEKVDAGRVVFLEFWKNAVELVVGSLLGFSALEILLVLFRKSEMNSLVANTAGEAGIFINQRLEDCLGLVDTISKPTE